MSKVLEQVGKHPISADEISERAELFGAEVKCLYMNKVPRPFHYGFLPTANNSLTFEGFLRRAVARGKLQ